jgi:hypothetical protein
MALLMRVNIATAFVVLAVLLGLFTPIADPARIAVNSQVARLRSGAVSPGAFDFNYLRADGGRYGRAALAELSTGDFGKATAAIHDMAKQAIAGTYVQGGAPVKVDLARNITVYPDTRALPRTFVAQNWNKTPGEVVSCLTTVGAKCDAFFVDLDGDGNEEVILAYGGAYLEATAYKALPDNSWTAIATMRSYCKGVLEALRAGKIGLVPPEEPLRDLIVAGFRVHPAATFKPVACPM